MKKVDTYEKFVDYMKDVYSQKFNDYKLTHSESVIDFFNACYNCMILASNDESLAYYSYHIYQLAMDLRDVEADNKESFLKEYWSLIREYARLLTGEYEPLVKGALPDEYNVFGHIVHISTRNPKLIAYTPTLEKREEDIQVQAKLGKYLGKTFADLKPHNIGSIVDRFNLLQFGDDGADLSNYKLKFAKTADEIEEIYSLDINLTAYENGEGRSCMQYDASYFESPVHPCRVYGYDDSLVLAYIVNQDNDVLGRAIVNLKRKEFVRTYFLYGYKDLFERILYNNGLQYNPSCLDGLHLDYIEYGNGFVAPYLDGHYTHAYVDGDHLVINNDGFALDQTNGLSFEVSTFSCNCCGDESDEDSGVLTENDGYVCSYCAENEYVWAYDQWKQEVLINVDEAVIVDNIYIANDALDENGYVEVRDENGMYEILAKEDCIYYEGEYYHPEYFEYNLESIVGEDEDDLKEAKELIGA